MRETFLFICSFYLLSCIWIITVQGNIDLKTAFVKLFN